MKSFRTIAICLFFFGLAVASSGQLPEISVEDRYLSRMVQALEGARLISIDLAVSPDGRDRLKLSPDQIAKLQRLRREVVIDEKFLIDLRGGEELADLDEREFAEYIQRIVARIPQIRKKASERIQAELTDRQLTELRRMYLNFVLKNVTRGLAHEDYILELSIDLPMDERRAIYKEVIMAEEELNRRMKVLRRELYRNAVSNAVGDRRAEEILGLSEDQKPGRDGGSGNPRR